MQKHHDVIKDIYQEPQHSFGDVGGGGLGNEVDTKKGSNLSENLFPYPVKPEGEIMYTPEQKTEALDGLIDKLKIFYADYKASLRGEFSGYKNWDYESYLRRENERSAFEYAFKYLAEVEVLRRRQAITDESSVKYRSQQEDIDGHNRRLSRDFGPPGTKSEEVIEDMRQAINDLLDVNPNLTSLVIMDYARTKFFSKQEDLYPNLSLHKRHN